MTTLKRYKLRSSSKVRTSGSLSSTSEGGDDQPSPNKHPRLLNDTERLQQHRRRKKVPNVVLKNAAKDPVKDFDEPKFKYSLTDLPVELLLHISSFLDGRSLLSLIKSSKWFYSHFHNCNPFWKLVCQREDLTHYDRILAEEDNLVEAPKLGYHSLPMRVKPSDDLCLWRRIFLKGVQMRRNILKGNYEGWRIYANSNQPLMKLTADLESSDIKRRLGDYPRLSENDDLKIDWNESFIVIFHFFRGEGETCKIRVWDITDTPTFKYGVDKGLEFITDRICLNGDYLVIAPSWPLEARALIMTLDVKNEMSEMGSFLFPDVPSQNALDENWEHTQLSLIDSQALVACRCPNWTLVVVNLPDCAHLFTVQLDAVSPLYDCQQIRAGKAGAMLLFLTKENDKQNMLVAFDMDGAKSKVRSCYPCSNISDFAFFSDPEELFLMKRNGDIVTYDANTKVETVRIPSNSPNDMSNTTSYDYQLFVNRKEQICVMQLGSDLPQGRTLKVYDMSYRNIYTVQLDALKYGISRDEMLAMYTNGAFLAVSDSRKILLFDVKDGTHLGTIPIPVHLERSKGKEEKDCMCEHTGISDIIFEEHRLIIVHDHERCYPSVMDFYKFW